MNLMRYVIFFFLLFVIKPAYASYQEGFLASIVLMISIPVIIAGALTSIILCRKKRFNPANNFYKKYMIIWGVYFVIASSFCMSEFHYCIVGNMIFALFILGLPTIQYFRTED